jgi:hypothetical protein
MNGTPRRPRHVSLTRKWPERYFAGLSKTMKLIRERELLRRKRTGKFKLGLSNKFARPKTSKWTQQFHRVFPGLKFNKNSIAKRTGIPRPTLDIVYDRGRRAWQTGGSRPGMTADQWGVARVYKFVLVSKKKAPVSWYMGKWDPNQNLRRVKKQNIN